MTISCEAEKNVTAKDKTATLYKLISGWDWPRKKIEEIKNTWDSSNHPLLRPRAEITYLSNNGAHRNLSEYGNPISANSPIVDFETFSSVNQA